MIDDGIRSEFVRQVQLALTNLYKPAELRRSPLIVVLGLEQQEDTVATLRRVLADGINTLKPVAGVPLSSSAWRIYHVLTYRYLEQSSQKQVANDLALSIRQLRRDEDIAVQVLADALWAAYRPQSPGDASDESDTSADKIDNKGSPSHMQELEWLREAFPGEQADIVDVLNLALHTLEPIMQNAHVDAVLTPLTQPLYVPIKPDILRQAVISLLLAAIHHAHDATLQLGVVSMSPQVQLRLVNPNAATHPAAAEVTEAVAAARELLALFGGSLLVESASGFNAMMSLPATTHPPIVVLVIDDHADAQLLMQRYLAGSRYQFHGCRDPEHAMGQTAVLAPQIIILDVMLPGIDGWELLGRLRLNPLTASVPVIVSTFLPQEQMALTLGAAAFLRKPVSRQSLLAALDQLAETPSQESR